VNALYDVTISHARSAPLRNVFRYRSYLWLVDLDHLPRVRLLAGFRARDHLGDPRASIRANLDRFLAANGVARPHTITMLTQARVLGYVFNPLTVYWCHGPARPRRGFSDQYQHAPARDGRPGPVARRGGGGGAARRNIGRHYDLSNDLFALFLDETMTYSSALFPPWDGVPAAGDLAEAPLLAEAQRRKIDRLLDRAGVGPGCRLLEVGTGWGELAIRAARRGATVRTITISREQQALAARRVAEAGLAGQVSVELRDYRDVDGRFDAICSVEMLEAVGERYWDGYFAALGRYLAPGGRIGLQTIAMAHDRMLATRHTYTWIHKYIFPGGLLPSVTAIQDSLARTTLRITGREDFGAHYAAAGTAGPATRR
jgi:cyclopropane fatty-acyl-phospholipid synthase-like methyltransferase